jgi:hypothetical protein
MDYNTKKHVGRLNGTNLGVRTLSNNFRVFRDKYHKHPSRFVWILFSHRQNLLRVVSDKVHFTNVMFTLN